MSTVNLDEARAARAAERAARGRGPGELVVGGEKFELPPELSLDALNCFGALAAGDASALELGLEAMVNGSLSFERTPILAGEDDEEGREPDAIVGFEPSPFDRLKAAAGGLTVDDAEFLIDEVCNAYGIESPKSSASATSSPSTSEPSRPTSDASTD